MSEQGTGAKVDRAFLTRGVLKTVLSNELVVLTKESHVRPIVATVLWYRVGSRNEEVGQTGKSHFLEHMLFKGTDLFQKGEIDMITHRNGGSNNAFTWLDFTAYYFTFASDRWEIALEIEANRMRNTSFELEEFESEKRVVQEELRIGLDGPWEALENEVWATAFRQHPYHWPTVGWLEDLENATAAEMKAYYDKWYHPRNATLVIVGDFDTATTLEKVEKAFGRLPAGPEVRPLGIVEPEQKGEKRLVVRKETPIERLLIGYHAPAVAHSDSYALHVAEAVLSTGKTSRLYSRMVDGDKSVTAVKATYNAHVDPSLFYVQAELKPGFALASAEEAIYQEIDRLRREPVSKAELDRAKRQMESDLVLTTEELLQQAILLGQYETIAFRESIREESRGYKYLSTFLTRIRAVSPEDVSRVAATYLGEDNRTVGYLIDDGSGTSGGGLTYSSGDRPFCDDKRERARSGLSHRVAFRTGKDRSDPAEISLDGVVDIKNPLHKPRSRHSRARNTVATIGSRALSLQVERVQLDNGLVLLLSENHSSPGVAIDVVSQVGSRAEPDDQAGLASLLGEVLDEGTKTRSSQEIADAVESVGGKLRAYGDYESSGIKASFLAEDISLGLEIVADLLMNAVFPDDKVAQFIERRIAQIKSRLDVPRVLASDIFNEIIFKGHPQHRPAIGYENTVSRLNRDSILDFYHCYWVPNNTILAIVGDFNSGELKSRVTELVGYWEPAPGLHPLELRKPERQREPITRYANASKEQVNILVGHIGIERKNPDYYALLVMDTILGSSPGFTSRIPRVLRDEQGLAYSTFSNITGSAGIDPGRFVAYIGTSPENLDRAITGLRTEIERIVREPVTNEELEISQDYLTGSFVFDFQTNSQIAEFLIDAEVYELGFDYLRDYPRIIRSVTIDDVTRVSRKYVDPECLTTVVVGPVDELGRLIDRH